MKEVFKMIAIAMMMVIVSSCEKAVTPEQEEEKDTTMNFTADFFGTKTGFNEGKLTWEAGDEIAICDGITVEYVTLTSANIKDGGASADFTTKKLATDAMTYYAVFPGACAYKDVNSQENSFIRDGRIQIYVGNLIALNKKHTFKSYAVASKAERHFMFNNVDAIIYFKTDRNDIASVEFKSNNLRNVGGNVLIDPTSGAIQPINLNGSNFIKYNLNGDKEAYIPVRAGTKFEGGYTLTAYDSNNIVLGTVRTSTDLTFENGKYYTIKDFDFRMFGTLPGKFTINSNGDQVYFSKGNLYWDGDSFEFETNQTDCAKEWKESHVSHFFWSKNASNAYSYAYTREVIQEGDVLFTNIPGFTVSGQKDTWYALSVDEWDFIIGASGFDSGTNSRDVDKRFAEATVEGVKGLLIFPDVFTWNTSMGTEPVYNKVEVKGEEFSNIYTADNFTVMQDAGVVFLPSSGCFYGIRESPHYLNPDYGWYWSSDYSNLPSETEVSAAYNLFFGDKIRSDSYDERCFAYCIRLVTDVK